MIDIISYIGATQGVFLSATYFSTRHTKSEHKLFFVLLCVITLTLVHFILNSLNQFNENLMIQNSLMCIEYLYGPLFYLYFRKATHLLVTTRHIYQAFIGTIIFYFLLDLVLNNSIMILDIWGLWLSFFAYKSIKLFIGFKVKHSNSYHVFIFYIAFTTFVLFYILNSHIELLCATYFCIIIQGSLTLFLFYLTFSRFIKQSYSDQAETKHQYKSSNLSETDIKSLHRKILFEFETNHIFLDPELTLSKCTEKVPASSHEISQVINMKLGCNYSQYISTLRVDYAKKQLVSHINSSVLSIAFQSGFKNKTTFNIAFKKQTGFTPTEFRNVYKE